MEDVIPSAMGLCCASVCARNDLTIEEVTKALNRDSPAGTTLSWSLSKDATFKGGEPNPCRCNSDSDRLHYLFNC